MTLGPPISLRLNEENRVILESEARLQRIPFREYLRQRIEGRQADSRETDLASRATSDLTQKVDQLASKVDALTAALAQSKANIPAGLVAELTLLLRSGTDAKTQADVRGKLQQLGYQIFKLDGQ